MASLNTATDLAAVVDAAHGAHEVRNNSDSAKQANQLAAGATEVVTRGGDVVSRVAICEKCNDAWLGSPSSRAR